MSRTMVKVRVSKKYHDYIDFQTVSLEYGHSQHFLLSWHDFEKLDRGEDVIAKSLQREDGATPCKAYFYRKAWAGELAVSFFWRDERRIKYNEDGSEDIVTTVEKRYKGHHQKKGLREGFFSRNASARPRNFQWD